MMKGIEFAEVRDTIVRAFDADEFDMFLYEKLNFDRPNEVADGPFKKVVTDVLRRFEQQGRDPYLIAAVAGARPMKADVQDVYRKYARGLIGAAYGQQVEAEQVKALEQYGLAPTVVPQTGGKAQLPGQLPATNEGFQKWINRALPQLNAWVWATQLLKQMRRVCRVEVGGAPRGTGFLVGPDVILTNHHVLDELIAAKGDGEQVACRFGYHVSDGGTPEEGTPVVLKPAFADWHLDSSPGLTDPEENAGLPVPTGDQLDHALVRLADDIGNQPIFPDGPTRGWVKVPAGPPALAEGMAMAILQHPKGEPVKLALDTDSVQKVGPTRVRYTTNTEQGSSGSPCFDTNWGLVALHHFGDSLHQQAQFNQGVPIAAIRARLTQVGAAKFLGGDPP
ncbi:MAG TPA: trypsin-like peptidase domain-containing protein [Gemmataceae bacterium]|nr:trypsin-like peptidase domain-containing protein [Gemmataceae bacterium]